MAQGSILSASHAAAGGGGGQRNFSWWYDLNCSLQILMLKSWSPVPYHVSMSGNRAPREVR